MPARSCCAACLPQNMHCAALCMVSLGRSAILLKPRQTCFPGGQIAVPDHAAPASVPATLTDVCAPMRSPEQPILSHAAVVQQAQPVHGQLMCPGSVSCQLCRQLSASGRSDCPAGASCQQQAARIFQHPRLAATLGNHPRYRPPCLCMIPREQSPAAWSPGRWRPGRSGGHLGSPRLSPDPHTCPLRRPAFTTCCPRTALRPASLPCGTAGAQSRRPTP